MAVTHNKTLRLFYFDAAHADAFVMPSDAEASNVLGNALDNDITGNAFDNILEGGEGADTLTGGGGNDVYVVDDAGDRVQEINAVDANDTVVSSIDYTLNQTGNLNIENLVLAAGLEIDGTGNSLANTMTGNELANKLDGGAGNDVLFGAAGVDELLGGAGNDILDGGAGIDSMTGGAGDDTYIVDDVGEAALLVEAAGGGSDTVRSSVSFALTADFEHLLLTGAGNLSGTGNDVANRLTGNTGANTLTGGAGNDTLDGGSGADRLDGGLGDDAFVIDNGGDVALGGEGIDSVTSGIHFALGADLENLYAASGTAALVLTGNGLANELVGNAGHNNLSGSSGNDWLAGGLGFDRLKGGSGRDFFVFDQAVSKSSVDVISDFRRVDDKIGLDQSVFTNLKIGRLSSGAFWMGRFAHDRSDRILYDDHTGKLYFDVDGIGGKSAIQIAALSNKVKGLTASSFVVGDFDL